MPIRHVKCPYPACTHSGEVLTNNHCETSHGMSRNELVKRYGSAEKLRVDDRETAKNRSMQKDSKFNPSYSSLTPRARQAREQKRTLTLEKPNNSSQYRKGGI